MNECAPGNGAWGVSYNLGWHGGVHLVAPAGTAANTSIPARAVADGVLVYRRLPTAREENNTAHALMYRGGWTDDGCVVIRHTTDIGTGEHATNISYFSIYMHLSAVSALIQNLAVGGKVWRKDIIGTAGMIYGQLPRLHFEMVCDQANLRKLAGRSTGQLDITRHGRTDALYGDIHFYVPAGTLAYTAALGDGTPCSGALAGANPPAAPAPQTHTVTAGQSLSGIARTYSVTVASLLAANRLPNANQIRVGQVLQISPPQPQAQPLAENLIVSMRLVKEGVGSGSCIMTTYHEAPAGSDTWVQVGDPVATPDYEYDLFKRAQDIARACQSQVPPPPASAIYELLRFGRAIGPDALGQARVAHWRQIAVAPNTSRFIDLGDPDRIKVFSDADFPHFKGWSLIDDDGNQDCLCESPTILGWLSGEQQGMTHEQRLARLNDAAVRDKLSKMLCRIPVDWDAATIDARWGWLRQASDALPEPLSEEDFARLRAHIEALAFWRDARANNASIIRSQAAPATEPAAPVDAEPPSVPDEESGSAEPASQESTEPDGPGNDFPDSRNCWHLPPKAFIEHMRKCRWMSRREMTQLLPRTGGLGWRRAHERLLFSGPDRNVNYVDLNRMFRRYGLDTSARQAAYLGQCLHETGKFSLTRERGTGRSHDYGAFYGRGIMQLTWASNYEAYGKYRGFADHQGAYTDNRITAASTHHWQRFQNVQGQRVIDQRQWSPRFDPEIVFSDTFNASDSGGYYWVSKSFIGEKNLNRLADQGLTPTAVGKLSYLVNGGDNGLTDRQICSAYVMRVISDTTADSLTETFTGIRRQSINSGSWTDVGDPYNVTVDYTPQRD